VLDRQPVLGGERLSLRPLVPEDWPALFAIASDHELWAMHPIHNRWQEEVFREFFADALAQGGALAVIERASGAIIGSSRFQAYNPAEGGSVEIGWTFIARRCWGTGINRELKRLMVGHALASVARVDFRVGEQNLLSRRALEKIGARLSPDRFEQVEVPGIGTVVHVTYELRKPDFESGLGAD
jgi:RimJ/RimL family protein N-acetyltransferase